LRGRRALLVLALGLLTTGAHAQTSTRILSGKVVLLAGKSSRPVAGRWVTLHRVGRDGSAPLDSMRSGSGGEFRFSFRPSGDSTAVYFAATQYAGIAYFTPPVRRDAATFGGEISVYDTTSALAPLTIVSRHVIVAAPDTGKGRDVLEMFVVANSGDRTLVTSLARQSTFEMPLPPRAIDPLVAEGDVAAEAMTFGGGVARVTAPIAPGTKRISFSYRMPATADPIEIAPSGTADVIEILVEDADASVTGTGITEEAPTSAEGRTFRRFTGQKFAGGSGISIVAPTGTSAPVSLVGALVAAAALVMSGALVVAARRSN
jgi:hypothetical protein